MSGRPGAAGTPAAAPILQPRPAGEAFALPVALLAAGAAAAPFVLGWVAVARNRLLSPRQVPLPAEAPVLAASGLFLLALAAMALLAWRRRPGLAELAAGLALPALLAATGLAARQALSDAPALARAAPAAGVWLAAGLLVLAAACCAARRGAAPLRFLLVALPGLALLLAAGWLDRLSLVQEARARSGDLLGALAQHLLIAGLALALAVLAAVPLALLARRHPRAESLLLGLANGLQVVPSIALFGLLMAPLAALAALWPALREVGIGGIGAAPAVIGIAVYLLLPLLSALLAGLRVAPPELVEAARGQGLSARQILWRLRLPLGRGVILGGLRTAAVQAVGLATLAALVGGGGFGAILFQGIGQFVAEVILLGVLPVILLSLLVDAALGALQRGLAP